ncbi:MAG: ABC transporter substrate-binding protein [Flavobacteriales bacterium]|nr:ABC transporter substrate-binding protein [Flavobacteriales bacterium]
MKIRVGGVPEHFNFPWRLAQRQGIFENIGIDLDWLEIKGGTGEMCSWLRTGDLDMAVVLTEGIVADIVRGNPSLIVQKFIKSPLVWGIHVVPESNITSFKTERFLRFAVTRMGSGSHLMAHIEMRNLGLQDTSYAFVELGTLERAIKEMHAKAADYLLWEKFTTMPYIESGQLVRIGECVTPWPCFCIAAREDFLARHPQEVWNLLWMLRKVCRHFMNDPNAPDMIAEEYGLDRTQARIWFNQTEWEQDVYISQKMLHNVMSTLKDVGVIQEEIHPDNLCWNRAIVY